MAVACSPGGAEPRSSLGAGCAMGFGSSWGPGCAGLGQDRVQAQDLKCSAESMSWLPGGFTQGEFGLGRGLLAVSGLPASGVCCIITRWKAYRCDGMACGVGLAGCDPLVPSYPLTQFPGGPHLSQVCSVRQVQWRGCCGLFRVHAAAGPRILQRGWHPWRSVSGCGVWRMPVGMAHRV